LSTPPALKFRQAWETNPVEKIGQPLQVADGAARVTLKPFGVVTIRLQ
jgi:hypothetical protein